MNSLGSTIRKHRKEAQLKVFELADKVGIHAAYLTQIEKDRRVPSPDVLRKIESALSIDLKNTYMHLKFPKDFFDSVLPFSNNTKQAEDAQRDNALFLHLLKGTGVDAETFATKLLKKLYPDAPKKDLTAKARAIAKGAEKFKAECKEHGLL